MDNQVNKKYLGIDWGEKRIGLALAEAGTDIALPFKVVNSLNEVLELIKEEEIDHIVLGQPLKMAGSDIALFQNFTEFFEDLKSKTNLSIDLMDERLSSVAADKLQGEKKDKAERDALAAMIILQAYIDKNFK